MPDPELWPKPRLNRISPAYQLPCWVGRPAGLARSCQGSPGSEHRKLIYVAFFLTKPLLHLWQFYAYICQLSCWISGSI